MFAGAYMEQWLDLPRGNRSPTITCTHKHTHCIKGKGSRKWRLWRNVERRPAAAGRVRIKGRERRFRNRGQWGKKRQEGRIQEIKSEGDEMS